MKKEGAEMERVSYNAESCVDRHRAWMQSSDILPLLSQEEKKPEQADSSEEKINRVTPAMMRKRKKMQKRAQACLKKLGLTADEAMEKYAVHLERIAELQRKAAELRERECGNDTALALKQLREGCIVFYGHLLDEGEPSVWHRAANIMQKLYKEYGVVTRCEIPDSKPEVRLYEAELLAEDGFSIEKDDILFCDRMYETVSSGKQNGKWCWYVECIEATDKMRYRVHITNDFGEKQCLPVSGYDLTLHGYYHTDSEKQRRVGKWIADAVSSGFALEGDCSMECEKESPPKFHFLSEEERMNAPMTVAFLMTALAFCLGCIGIENAGIPKTVLLVICAVITVCSVPFWIKGAFLNSKISADAGLCDIFRELEKECKK